MQLLVVLLDCSVISLPFDASTTVAGLAKMIAVRLNVSANSVFYYSGDNLIFPNVRIINAAERDMLSAVCPWDPRVSTSSWARPQQDIAPVTNYVQSLMCKIGKAVIRMIIDTGASSCVLYANHIREAELEDFVDRNPSCHFVFDMANGTTMTSMGIIHSTDVRIGRIQTISRFVILPNTKTSGLLGIDWLKQNNALIDPANHRIRLQGQAIPLD
jgi:predicted aspartyl protease